jgi:hypothetical protein
MGTEKSSDRLSGYTSFLSKGYYDHNMGEDIIFELHLLHLLPVATMEMSIEQHSIY